MIPNLEELFAGNRYLVYTYSRGSSGTQEGYAKAIVYQMCGSEIEAEDVEFVADPGQSHIRLELLSIEAALQKIGKTDLPIVVVSRLEYLSEHAATLRANDFKKADGHDAENIDVWRRIESLDPDDRIEWRFVGRDYEEIIADRKEEKEATLLMDRAVVRDRS